MDTATNALSSAEQQAVSRIAGLQANCKSATVVYNTVEFAAKTALNDVQSARDSACDMYVLRPSNLAPRARGDTALMRGPRHLHNDPHLGLKHQCVVAAPAPYQLCLLYPGRACSPALCCMLFILCGT